MKISQLTGLIMLISVLFNEEVQTPAYTYAGGWPVNPRSDKIVDPGFDLLCPGPLAVNVHPMWVVTTRTAVHTRGGIIVFQKQVI